MSFKSFCKEKFQTKASRDSEKKYLTKISSQSLKQTRPWESFYNIAIQLNVLALILTGKPAFWQLCLISSQNQLKQKYFLQLLQSLNFQNFNEVESSKQLGAIKFPSNLCTLCIFSCQLHLDTQISSQLLTETATDQEHSSTVHPQAIDKSLWRSLLSRRKLKFH